MDLEGELGRYLDHTGIGNNRGEAGDGDGLSICSRQIGARISERRMIQDIETVCAKLYGGLMERDGEVLEQRHIDTVEARTYDSLTATRA